VINHIFMINISNKELWASSRIYRKLAVCLKGLALQTAKIHKSPRTSGVTELEPFAGAIYMILCQRIFFNNIYCT